MHRRENPALAASGQIIGGYEQHFMDIHHALGRDSQPREHRHQNVVPPIRDSPHLQPRPPRLRRRLRQIPLLHHLEPYLLSHGGDVAVAPEPRQRVAPLDPLNHLHVLRVVAAVQLRRHPLVRHVVRAGL